MLEKLGRRGRQPDGQTRMTLVGHLVELRNRLLKMAIAVGVCAVAGWFLYPLLIQALIDPYQSLEGTIGGGRLLQQDPLEGFSVRIKITAYTAIILAMPVLLWQIWRFVTPGLHANEKRYALPFVASASVLFILGAGIAYWTLPKAIGWLASVGGSDFAQFYSPSKYFTLVVYMMLAFGVGFEFPILLVFLQMVGILNTALLRQWRRYVIVGIVVFVAVVTPSTDPLSLLALTIPMVVFYEVSILIGRLLQRRRSAARK